MLKWYNRLTFNLLRSELGNLQWISGGSSYSQFARIMRHSFCLFYFFDYSCLIFNHMFMRSFFHFFCLWISWMCEKFSVKCNWSFWLIPMLLIFVDRQNLNFNEHSIHSHLTGFLDLFCGISMSWRHRIELHFNRSSAIDFLSIS